MEPIRTMNELQTPCFIFDPMELKRSLEGFKNALEKNFTDPIVSYSVKTNSIPKCMRLACDMGAYAEVVSYDEYELSLLCGFQKKHIVYNGPMKSKDTFIDAIINGAIVNIETKRELEWLAELPVDKIYNIGLRLNVNISHISPNDADGDNDNSRFGFSDETSEFLDAINKIKELKNISLNGLHIHRTSHSRSVSFYKAAISFACKVIKKYKLKLDYLDLGGGYFGIFPNKPTYMEYSKAFYDVLIANSLENLKIVVEPGNALVASCFSFLSEVIDVKHVEENLWFITTDGSRNDIDPFFKKKSYLNEVFYKQEKPIVNKQIVCGCTCLEYDRMFVLEQEPLLSVGDNIYYHNVGAYTMCLSPMFIRYIPNIYIKKGDSFELIREKWTPKEYIIKNIL